MLNQKRVLHDQMDEKRQQAEEAQEQFLREKSQVDAIVQKIINEDLAKLELDKKKKSEAF